MKKTTRYLVNETTPSNNVRQQSPWSHLQNLPGAVHVPAQGLDDAHGGELLALVPLPAQLLHNLVGDPGLLGPRPFARPARELPQPVQLPSRQLRLRPRGLPRLLLSPQRDLEALVPRRRPRHRPRLRLLHRRLAGLLLPRLDREVERDGCGGVVVAGGDGARGVGELEGADAADDSEDGAAGAASGDARGEGLGGRLGAGVS